MSKHACLTIDDAPSPDFLQKIDWLESRGIPAIFFCTGENLAARPEMAAEALQRGFVVGIHSWDHPHFSRIPLKACFEQIRRADAVLTQIYKKAGIPDYPKYFRFPYGDKGALTGDDPFTSPSGEGLARKQSIQKYLRSLGYTQPAFDGIAYGYYRRAGLLDDADWYWTYDVREWCTFHPEAAHGIRTLDDVLARMDEVEPENGLGLNTPGSDEIILTHDHTETSSIFPDIINRLLKKGLEFYIP